MNRVPQFELQKLEYTDLQTLVQWASAEGWNPGIHDAEVFWNADPEGYYGYRHNGELIAGGSVVSYDGLFGFMGFFIVKPEYRSKGTGRALWFQRRDILLSRLQPGASIGMDGVVAMQPFYQNGGFEIAFRDIRHETIGASMEVAEEITRVEEADIPAILSYDLQCFGFPRPRFLGPWLRMPMATGFKFKQDGILRGYAVIRKALKGYKVGPLFADTPPIAEELYKACLNASKGDSLYLDIPAANPEAVKMTEKFRTVPMFECARMYYGSPPKIALHKVFGITTFELG